MSDSESKTDWARVLADYNSDEPIWFDPEDEPYDPNDDAAVEAYWAPALEAHKAAVAAKKDAEKEQVVIELSRDVAEHYRSKGEGWQAQVEAILREHMAS